MTFKIQNEVSKALEAPYQELRVALPGEKRVFMDESPTNEAGKKAWLWAVVTPLYAVYSIFLSRAGTAVDQLLGNAFSGFVNCDRAKMYWRIAHLQWCWSHLKRDVQALIDRPDGQARRLGHDLMRQVTALFKHWRAYHEGKITRRTFKQRMAPVRAQVDSELLRGSFSGNTRFVGMCTELYENRERL